MTILTTRAHPLRLAAAAATVTALSASVLAVLPARADLDPTSVVAGRVHAPTVAEGEAALLVVLPEPGRSAGEYESLAAATQTSATGVRLWVSIAGTGSSPADALARFELATASAADAGFEGDAVLVAGDGMAAHGVAEIAAAHDLVGTALLGADLPTAELALLDEPALRIGGELDRRVRVSRLAKAAVENVAGQPAVVLGGADAADLRSTAGGAVLGALVSTAVTGSAALDDARDAADGLTAAFRDAFGREAGDECAGLQHHTADLGVDDAGRLDAVNRPDSDLVDPDPDDPDFIALDPEQPSPFFYDLGGFLYDKAELADDGDGTATATTNSHTVHTTGSVDDVDLPVGAAEIMCKTRSRDAVAQVLGRPLRDTGPIDDPERPTCQEATEQLLAWALEAVSEPARQRFAGIEVRPDDHKRAGPEWVFAPLFLAPSPGASGSWIIQSPSLFTKIDVAIDDEFAGNHYCKLASPVRMLELVLIDAVEPGS